MFFFSSGYWRFGARCPEASGGKGGPTTDFELQHVPNFTPTQQPTSPTRLNESQSFCFWHLLRWYTWDTGATCFCLLLAGLQKLDCLFFQNVTWHGSGGPKQCSTYRPQAGATCSIQSIAAVHCISATNWFPLSVAAHKGNGMGRAEGGLHGVS